MHALPCDSLFWGVCSVDAFIEERKQFLQSAAQRRSLENQLRECTLIIILLFQPKSTSYRP